MDPLSTELIKNSGNTWTLKLIGSVNPRTHQLMWHAESSALLLEQLLKANVKTLFIELSETERFDSHGLRLLLSAQRDFAAKNITTVLRNPNSHLYRLFQIMQFDRAFTIEFDN